MWKGTVLNLIQFFTCLSLRCNEITRKWHWPYFYFFLHLPWTGAVEATSYLQLLLKLNSTASNKQIHYFSKKSYSFTQKNTLSWTELAKVIRGWQCACLQVTGTAEELRKISFKLSNMLHLQGHTFGYFYQVQKKKKNTIVQVTKRQASKPKNRIERTKFDKFICFNV